MKEAKLSGHLSQRDRDGNRETIKWRNSEQLPLFSSSAFKLPENKLSAFLQHQNKINTSQSNCSHIKKVLQSDLSPFSVVVVVFSVLLFSDLPNGPIDYS